MYKMVELKYNYKDLEPYYNEKMFNYHYNVLYKNYTDDLNNIIDKLNKKRKEDDFSNIQDLEKKLIYYSNAYILHSLFFENLTPMPNKTLLSKELIDHIKKDFNSYDSFIDELNFSLINAKEFSFIVFGYNKFLNRLFINEIENYFEYSSIDFIPLLVIDVFSHSYKNDKKEYIRNLFYILDFNIVNDRYNKIYML